MELKKTARIDLLKERMLSQPRYVSMEQAMIITRAYQRHEEEPVILKRAYALHDALCELEIGIEPQELIVGNRTKGVRYGVVFPESGISWVDQELETLPTRPQDKFLVRPEDVQTFREVIKPYWKGKSLEDVLKKRYGKELSALSTVVKINQKDHAPVSYTHLLTSHDVYRTYGIWILLQQLLIGFLVGSEVPIPGCLLYTSRCV